MGHNRSFQYTINYPSGALFSGHCDLDDVILSLDILPNGSTVHHFWSKIYTKGEDLAGKSPMELMDERLSSSILEESLPPAPSEDALAQVFARFFGVGGTQTA